MASTPAGRALTEQHRRRQLLVRAATLRQVLDLWPAFDITRIDESWRSMEAGLLAIAEARRANSAAIAGGYYQAVRTAEGVPGAAQIVAPDGGWIAPARVSLQVTGPIGAKQLVAKRDPRAAAKTQVKVLGAMERIALNGGRETLTRTIESDRRALGWARVTSGSPCAFCAMLASRGAVYGEQGGDFQAHDHCSCSLEPAFRRDEARSPQAAELARQWNEATRGLSGAEARTAFRRAHEGR